MTRPIELLIVDQDAETRFNINRLLAQSSVSVRGEAPFGTEAVSRALEQRPDVILCALEEPLIRPLETIEALLHALPETPLVAYSSRGELEIARKAMHAGARDFLVQPLSRSAIESAVQSALESEEDRRMRLSGRAAIGFEGTVVAVYSAKGGVGKTTFATNLTAALAHQVGQSVVLVDADTSFGDVAVAMGLPSEVGGLRSLLSDLESGDVDLARHVVPHSSGAQVLAGPGDPIAWQTIAPDRFGSVIELLRRSHDYVVVDLDATPNPITLTTLQRASVIFWMVTPDVFTMNDNMRALRLLRDRYIRPDATRFVINNVHPRPELSRDVVEDAVEASIYWEIPHDPLLHRRTQIGETVDQWSEDSKGAASIIALAGALAGVTTNGHRRVRPLERMRALLGVG
jgi:pilus assembly protein CpaE